jgi:hypothetical protein
VGVSILAVLHLVGGLGLAALQVVLLSQMGAIEETLRSIGLPPWVLIVGVLFLTALAIASAVGMWTGARWGWWLAAFYYMYGVFRNATALYTVAAMSGLLEDSSRGPEYYFVKHAIRLVVSLLLFCYFFKTNVLEFFGLADLSKATTIAILVGLCVALTAFASAVSYFSV